jgi:hypothetical protein
MDKSSPADLVVAFRSFVRRQAEAVEAAEGAPIGGYVAELHRHLDEAGALMGVGGDPTAIANAIAERPADHFDVATLDGLRQHALAIGSVLRRMGDVHHPAD